MMTVGINRVNNMTTKLFAYLVKKVIARTTATSLLVVKKRAFHRVREQTLGFPESQSQCSGRLPLGGRKKRGRRRETTTTTSPFWHIPSRRRGRVEGGSPTGMQMHLNSKKAVLFLTLDFHSSFPERLHFARLELNCFGMGYATIT